MCFQQTHEANVSFYREIHTHDMQSAYESCHFREENQWYLTRNKKPAFVDLCLKSRTCCLGSYLRILTCKSANLIVVNCIFAILE